MNLIFFIFLLFIPIKSLSNKIVPKNPNFCPKGFEIPDLNSEKYQPKALRAAMNSHDYQSIINNYFRLSRKDEEDLFHLYRNGTKKEKERAFQILFLSNLYLVRFVVKKYRWHKKHYDDLFQEGVTAILESLEQFNITRGVRFSTYLFQAVSSRLISYIGRKVSTIPIKWTPQRREIYDAFLPYKDSVDFESKLELYIHKIAEENPEYSIKNIRMVGQFILPPKFLGYDTPIKPINNKSNSTTVGELISDTRIDVEAEVISKSDLQRIYSWAQKRFPEEIDQTILRDMLFSSDPKTITEIGKEFSITRQAIQHRYKKIIRLIQDEFLND